MTNPIPTLACPPVACSVNQRQEFDSVTHSLLAAAQERRELENGYALRFDAESGRLTQIAEFIERERVCCPFLTFSLVIEPAQGPVWLRLTGPEGAKEVLKSEGGFA